MGNIEIREQNPRNRRTNIFSDRKSITPSKNYFPQTARSPRSYTPKNQRTTMFSPIKFSNINTANSNNEEILVTERKANTSIPNTSRLYDGLEYSQINNLAKKLEISTTNKRQNRQFQNKVSMIQNKQNQEDLSYQKYPKTQRSAHPGRIVSNIKIKHKNIKQILTESIPKYKSNKVQSQNFLQNKQIIKKVRNFNDFLNQIKKKLKEDKQKNLIKNKSGYKYIPKLPRNASNFKENATQINEKTNDTATKQNIFSPKDLNREQNGQTNTMQKDRSTRRLQVALKLENQKLELQKYRKLVQRQLSKTHSIENIFLQTKPSGEKILTIQYETILTHSNIPDQNNNAQNQNSKSNFSKETSKKSLIHNLSDKNYQKSSKSTQKAQQNDGKLFSKITIKQKINDFLNQKPRKYSAQQAKNISQQILLNKLKSEYQSTLSNLLQLGKIIQQYQKKISQTSYQKSSLQSLNNKKPSLLIYRSKTSSQQPNNIQKIQNLFRKLSDIQQKYQQTDRQIKNMIQLEQQNSESQLQNREVDNSLAKESSQIVVNGIM